MNREDTANIDRRPAQPVRLEKPSGRSNVSIPQWSGRVILIGLVTVTPWLFGGVGASVQPWLFLGVLAALACWFLRGGSRDAAGAVLPLAAAPLVLAVLFGVFQLVPLGSHAAAWFSPKGVELRSRLGSGDPASAEPEEETLGIAAAPTRQPISLYPAATRSALAMLALGLAVFVLGAVFFNKPAAQIGLCIVIAINGAALALFGLVQKLSWNGLLYWKVPMSEGGSPFGPFVNQNNAAGFLNLCLAGAVGMTVWAVGRSRSSRPPESSIPHRMNLRQGASRWQRMQELLAHPSAVTLAAVGLAGSIVAGVLCSLSRGAGIAMAVATLLVVAALVLVRGRKGRAWCLGAAATVGLALVIWAGMYPAVQARFAMLTDPAAISQHALIPHWRDTFRAAPDFWRAGSGLGTYRYVYGMYQRHPFPRWFHHAENEYLESLIEGGLPGLALILVTIGVVGVAAWRLARCGRDAEALAFGIAGLFALTAQVVHAFCDFGLHIPANMMLLALICGAVCGGAAGQARRAPGLGATPLPRGFSFSTLFAALLLVAVVLGYRETRRASAVRIALESVRFQQRPEDLSARALSRGAGRLAAAVGRRPDDAEAQQRLAELWTDLYRVRAREQLLRERGGAADRADLWNLTAPAVIHGRAQQFAGGDDRQGVERLRAEPVIRDHLTPALAHLLLARRSCPLLPWVHVQIAELCVLAADPARDRVHVARSRRLAPCDAELQFRCGLLDFQAGRVGAAYASWRRCLALSSDRREDIFRIVRPQLRSPETLRKLLPDSPRLLVQLAETQFAAEEDADVRRVLVRRAAALVEQADLPEGQRYRLRGSICALRQDYPEAIENYSRAVTLRSDQLAWRYELALLLERQGRLEEAHRQAKRCARAAPRDRKFYHLLEQIHETQLRQ